MYICTYTYTFIHPRECCRECIKFPEMGPGTQFRGTALFLKYKALGSKLKPQKKPCFSSEYFLLFLRLF